MGHQDAMDVGEFPGAAEFLPFLPPRTGVAGARGFVAGVGEAQGIEPQWVSILARGREVPRNVGCNSSQVFVTFFCIPAKGACLLCNLQPNRGSSALFQLGHAGEFTARVLKLVSRISQCRQKKNQEGRDSGQRESKTPDM